MISICHALLLALANWNQDTYTDETEQKTEAEKKFTRNVLINKR